MIVMDKIISFTTALLLKKVAEGQWKFSGTKIVGICSILFGALGYLLGNLTYEQASGFVGGGLTAIFLRKGQESETSNVTVQLDKQNEKLVALDILLEKVEKLTEEKP